MTSAELARDQGIAEVTRPNVAWMDSALQLLPDIVREEVTGEEIRHRIAVILGAPSHHNAWGALINHAVRSGLIKSTGRWEKMKDRQSHARKTPVYMEGTRT